MNNKGYIVCSDELYHYGVPGMKWGQRKIEESSSSIRTKKIKRLQEKEYRARQKRAQKEKLNRIKQERKFVDPSKLTMAEMDAKIRRMQKEQKYIQTVRQTQKIAKGKDASDRTLNRIGKEIASKTASYYSYKVANTLINQVNKKVDPLLGFNNSTPTPIGGVYKDKKTTKTQTIKVAVERIKI